MKYLLVDGWNDYSEITDNYRESVTNTIVLLYATFLQINGKEVFLLDSSTPEFSKEELIYFIKTENIKNIIFFADVDNIHAILTLAIKMQYGHRITILSFNEEFSDLLQGSEIKNIVYDEKKCTKSNLRSFIEKQELPLNTKNIFSFPINYNLYSNLKDKTVLINVGTGCAASCTFCSIAGSRIDYKDINILMGEIESLLERGVVFFHILNHNFGFDSAFVEEFCKRLMNLSRHYDFGWSCFIVPGFFNTELFPVMVDAKLKKIEIACESGSERILKDLGLKHRNIDVENLINAAIASNISLIRTHFIISSPTETNYSLQETKEFISKIFFITYALSDICIHYYYPENVYPAITYDYITRKRTGPIKDLLNISLLEIATFVKETRAMIKTIRKDFQQKAPIKQQYEHYELNVKYNQPSQFYSDIIAKSYKNKLFQNKFYSYIYFSWEIMDIIEKFTPVFYKPKIYPSEKMSNDFSNYKIILYNYIVQGMTVKELIDKISEETNNVISVNIVMQALYEWENEFNLFYIKNVQ